MGVIVRRDKTGAEIPLGAGETVSVESSSDGFLSNAIDGALALVNGEPVSHKEYIWGSIALHAANTIGTSMYTRRRVAQGKAPVAKVLF